MDGIDVSRWQGVIDWPAVAAAGIDFTLAKATEGTTRTDPRWAANRAGATGAGVPIGGYHFARPGQVTAPASARHHLAVAHPRAGELVPVLDLESTTLSARDTTRWALEWLAIVEQAVGAQPVVYTGPGWAATNLHPDPALGRYPLWVAHYTRSAAPRLPKPWTSWLWWQHTDSGRVPGINGDVDLNRMTGDRLPTVGAKPAPPTTNPKEDPLVAVTEADWAQLRQIVEATALTVTALRQEIVDPQNPENGETRLDRMAKWGAVLDAIQSEQARIDARLTAIEARLPKAKA